MVERSRWPRSRCTSGGDARVDQEGGVCVEGWGDEVPLPGRRGRGLPGREPSVPPPAVHAAGCRAKDCRWGSTGQGFSVEPSPPQSDAPPRIPKAIGGMTSVGSSNSDFSVVTRQRYAERPYQLGYALLRASRTLVARRPLGAGEQRSRGSPRAWIKYQRTPAPSCGRCRIGDSPAITRTVLPRESDDLLAAVVPKPPPARTT